MRIVLLSHDLSGNAAGRAFILAKALEPFAEVELWGPASRGTVWGPIADSDLTTRVYEVGKFPGAALAWRSLVPKLEGVDALYSVKPLYASYGVGRNVAAAAGIPHVLDTDDWELGFVTTGGVMWKVRAEGLLRLREPISYFHTARLDRLGRQEERVTVSNEFLRERFGGTLVPHGRDLREFDPARFDAEKLKEARGLAGKRVVLFFGTPLRHKGVDVLIEAVRGIPDEDVVLAIVGVGHHEPYSLYLRDLARREPRIRVFGEVPFSEAPSVLPIGDVVVVPQLREIGNLGQIPAKLGDAMAMGRAVVTTPVGDIPRVLGDAGVLVPPGDAAALRDAIARLLDDAALREQMGKRARARAAEELSLDVMTRRLKRVFMG